MANLARGGLRWVRGRGGEDTPPIEIWPVANNYNTGIFRGDVVKLAADGTAQACGAATLGYGVMVGAEQYVEAGVLRKGGNFLPASTTFTPSTVGSVNESRIRVIPLKGQVFEIDVNAAAASEAAAASYVNENAEIAVGSGGNTNTGVSSYVLDGATHAGTATLQFRIIGIVPGPTNDVLSTNWKVLVEANLNQSPPSTVAGA